MKEGKNKKQSFWSLKEKRKVPTRRKTYFQTLGNMNMHKKQKNQKNRENRPPSVENLSVN